MTPGKGKAEALATALTKPNSDSELSREDETTMASITNELREEIERLYAQIS